MRRPATVRAIADPAARIRAARDSISEHQRVVTELAEITADAVAEMRRTMSYRQIAAAIGVSSTRVQQLERRPTQTEKDD